MDLALAYGEATPFVLLLQMVNRRYDLLLRAKGNQQPIEVVLVGGGAPVCFSVPGPTG